VRRSRESTELHSDYYRTTNKTANPSEHGERVMKRRQATSACRARSVRSPPTIVAAPRRTTRVMAKTSIKQGFFAPTLFSLRKNFHRFSARAQRPGRGVGKEFTLLKNRLIIARQVVAPASGIDFTRANHRK